MQKRPPRPSLGGVGTGTRSTAPRPGLVDMGSRRARAGTSGATCVNARLKSRASDSTGRPSGIQTLTRRFEETRDKAVDLTNQEFRLLDGLLEAHVRWVKSWGALPELRQRVGIDLPE
jgi:hypothetical protein